jgi:hypothetical protein
MELNLLRPLYIDVASLFVCSKFLGNHKCARLHTSPQPVDPLRVVSSFVFNLLFVLWFRSEEEVLNVHARLRLSGVERDTCLFVVANRQDKESYQNL